MTSRGSRLWPDRSAAFPDMFSSTSAVEVHFTSRSLTSDGMDSLTQTDHSWDYPNHAKLFSAPKWPVLKPLRGLVRRFLNPERKTFARDAQK